MPRRTLISILYPTRTCLDLPLQCGWLCFHHPCRLNVPQHTRRFAFQFWRFHHWFEDWHMAPPIDRGQCDLKTLLHSFHDFFPFPDHMDRFDPCFDGFIIGLKIAFKFVCDIHSRWSYSLRNQVLVCLVWPAVDSTAWPTDMAPPALEHSWITQIRWTCLHSSEMPLPLSVSCKYAEAVSKRNIWQTMAIKHSKTSFRIHWLGQVCRWFTCKQSATFHRFLANLRNYDWRPNSLRRSSLIIVWSSFFHNFGDLSDVSAKRNMNG